MSKVEVTEKELSEKSSKFAQAVKKLKKECAHQKRQIMFLKHQNEDLRESDMWRTQKMEMQALEICILKSLLTDAGYDLQNLAQPKGLRIVSNPPNPPPASGFNTPTPKSRSNFKLSSPYKCSDPAPKRKHTESFDKDEESNPHQKGRALSSIEFLESNIYTCEEMYTQYLVDYQLGYDIPNLEDDDIDLDEDEDYDEQVEEGAEHGSGEKETPENPALLFKAYLAQNNPPASWQLDNAKYMATQMVKEREQPQYTTKENERYQAKVKLAIKRSLEDAEWERG